jgi:hypothetical protein
LGKSKSKKVEDKLIKYVYGTEINEERYKKGKRLIKSQITDLKVDSETAVSVKYSYGDKVINYNNKSFTDTYLNILKQFPDVNHAFFLDPPWGGREYKNYDYVLFGLGGESLTNIVNTIKTNTSKTVHLYIKVPNNFFTEELEKNKIVFEKRDKTKDVKDGSMRPFREFTVLYIKIVGATVPAASLVSAAANDVPLATPVSAAPVSAAPVSAAPVKRKLIRKKQVTPAVASEAVASEAVASEAVASEAVAKVATTEQKEQNEEVKQSEPTNPIMEYDGGNKKTQSKKRKKEEIEKNEKKKKVSIKRIRKKIMLTE